MLPHFLYMYSQKMFSLHGKNNFGKSFISRKTNARAPKKQVLQRKIFPNTYSQRNANLCFYDLAKQMY